MLAHGTNCTLTSLLIWNRRIPDCLMLYDSLTPTGRSTVFPRESIHLTAAFSVIALALQRLIDQTFGETIVLRILF
jgi:hypothetical protein